MHSVRWFRGPLNRSVVGRRGEWCNVLEDDGYWTSAASTTIGGPTTARARLDPVAADYWECGECVECSVQLFKPYAQLGTIRSGWVSIGVGGSAEQCSKWLPPWRTATAPVCSP